MRGALPVDQVKTGDWRIIPAYAGSTLLTGLRGVRTGDHPRVCGEHTRPLFRVILWWGSSPRMRGARLEPTMGSGWLGIIPAYAGSTQGRDSLPYHLGDHPRVCGEHRQGRRCCSGRAGSSPRMRGALLPKQHDEDFRRIIPAYAGSTVGC